MGTATDHPVIVGVDGTQASTEAVRWAAHEASRRGVALKIVHAGYYLYEPMLTRFTAQTVIYELDQHSRRVIDDALRLVTDITPDLEMSTETHEGDPVRYLVRQSGAAAVMVLGTHTTGSLAGVILMSISQSVAAHAHCPVVVMNADRPQDAVAKRAVVVGVSPSSGGTEALRFAFEAAQQRAVPLIAVRSWGDIEWGAVGLGYSAEIFRDWEHGEARVLEECLNRVRGDFPTVQVETRLVSVRAQWALEHQAIGADLLVVGCHRPDDHWFSRLGSVASWLLHRAPCPLVIVGQPHHAPPKSAGADVGAAYTQ